MASGTCTGREYIGRGRRRREQRCTPFSHRPGPRSHRGTRTLSSGRRRGLSSCRHPRTAWAEEVVPIMQMQKEHEARRPSPVLSTRTPPYLLRVRVFPCMLCVHVRSVVCAGASRAGGPRAHAKGRGAPRASATNQPNQGGDGRADRKRKKAAIVYACALTWRLRSRRWPALRTHACATHTRGRTHMSIDMHMYPPGPSAPYPHTRSHTCTRVVLV